MKAQLRSLEIGGAPAGLRHKCLAAIFISILGTTGLGLQAQETAAVGGVRKTAAPAQMAPVRTIAFSPDGTSLLVGGGPKDRAGQVTLWNLATRNPVWRASLPGGVYSSAFAPDGKKLAVAFSQSEVRLLDPATGKLLGTLKGPAKGVQPVAFSFDGKTLAAGGLDGAIVLWDVASGQTRLTVPAHKGNIYSLAFSPDGKWLVSGGEDYTARLWSVATGKQERAMPRSGSIVPSVAFSPDGRWIATGSWDGSLRIYDGVSGRLRAQIENGSVNRLAFSPDGRYLAACNVESPEVEVYRPDLRDPNREESQRIRKMMTDLNDDSYAVREKASAGLKGLGLIAVPELDKATNSPLPEVRVRSRAILADARSPQPWAELNAGSEPLAVAFSPDSRMMAAGGRDGRVQLWDVKSQQLVGTLALAGAEAGRDVASAPIGGRIAPERKPIHANLPK
jgi:WD40 repeat protein